MKGRIGIVACVSAGLLALGCSEPPSTPMITAPLFAAATTTPVTATATLTITDSGTLRVSGRVAHIRDQTQAGPVSGDITGSITVTGRSDVKVATMTGTGSGEFTITTAGGTWEGRYQGRFNEGVFSGKLVARGTGDLAGLHLRGNISQQAANRSYTLEATILNPGG